MGQTLELTDRKTGSIALLTMYRIMAIRHMNRPNDDAQFKIDLRECLTFSERTTLQGEPIDIQAIVPASMKEEVLAAFNNDVNILAQVNNGCLQSLVTLSFPSQFDAIGYVSKYGRDD